MSGDSRLVGESIEELLVALATGIREAQETLNEIMPIDAFGRPLPTYHIPYVDFEIGVQIETQRQESGRPILRLIGQASGGSSTQSSQTRSTISGRLVAVPPGEGLPVPALRLTAEPTSARKRRIIVQVSNSAGELLTGKRVELNIDVAASLQLSRANDPSVGPPKAGTRLTEAILVTDANGEASTEVSLDPAEHPKAIIVVAAQAGVATAKLSVTPGAGS